MLRIGSGFVTNPRKQIITTLPGITEELVTPVALGTSEPASATIGYTLTQNMFPTIIPTPTGIAYIAQIIGVVQNTGGASASINSRCYKNSANVMGTSSTPVTNGNYGTVHAYFYGVSVNDVLDLRLWGPTFNFIYKSITIYPTKVLVGSSGKPRLNVLFTNLKHTSQAALGNPSPFSVAQYYSPQSDNTTMGLISIPTNYVALTPTSSNGFFRAYFGDTSSSNGVTYRTHASYYPYYDDSYIPTLIEYSEV